MSSARSQLKMQREYEALYFEISEQTTLGNLVNRYDMAYKLGEEVRMKKLSNLIFDILTDYELVERVNDRPMHSVNGKLVPFHSHWGIVRLARKLVVRYVSKILYRK